MKITHDYFLTEWHRFREIMCSSKYEPQQKFDAYCGLLQVYFLCETQGEPETETREAAMGMLQAEFPIRMGLDMATRFEKLFLEAGLAPDTTAFLEETSHGTA